MNRRAFLRWLGGTAAGVAASHVLDVERLLWVPGEKTILLPTVEGVEHLNGLVSVDWMMAEALRIMEANLQFVASLPLIDTRWGTVDVRIPRVWETHR